DRAHHPRARRRRPRRPRHPDPRRRDRERHALHAGGSSGMSWRDVLHTATDAVRSHRLRSALTMLGILIGITAVVLTVGIGEGAKAKVKEQINELGNNTL